MAHADTSKTEKPEFKPDQKPEYPGESLYDTGVIVAYLKERIPLYRDLDTLRQNGWASEAGAVAWAEQRQRADHTSVGMSKNMFRMMENNARELHDNTNAFHISRIGTDSEPQHIIDFCMAPGGFLSIARAANPGAHALALTLPHVQGGHRVELPKHKHVDVKYVDMNILAGDMDVSRIPQGHEEAERFLPRMLPKDRKMFDLAICGGAVLRTHERASYREHGEALRLSMTQLAMGLEHLREGGTMIILQHKVEAMRTVRLMHQFSKFSTVRLFKPSKAHNTRSSCYMIASGIGVRQPEAIAAVEGWKKVWRRATFGTEEEFKEVMGGNLTAQELLNEFGDQLIELGMQVWKIQRDALARKNWTR